MATTVRSIGAMPFQGGSFNTDKTGHGMVRLSTSRMVWLYYQTSPNWLAASVIDVSGGITSQGTATLTNQQLLMPLTQSNYMTCARINQTTFMMMTGVYTGNMSWYVFEVDPQGVFTRVDMGQFGFGTTTTAAALSTFAQTNFKIVELKDNLVMYVAQGTNGSSISTTQGVKGTYNTTTKTMTWDVAPTILFSNLINNCEITARPIPGRDLTLIQHRYFSSGVGELRGATGVVINNQTGAIQVPWNKLPVTTANIGLGDMVPLPGDRMAYLTSNYSIAWVSIDYTAGSFISLGSSGFTNVTAIDTAGHYLLPLTTDYVLKMTRNSLSNPVNFPHRFKVIRRVDQNMNEQSAASSQNGNTGFSLNGTPTTYANFHQTYPEFIDGKVVWFGLDRTNNQFSWTVVGLEP